MKNFSFLFVLVLLGCFRKDDEPVNTDFDMNATLTHNGVTRSYLVHLPPGYYTTTSLKPLVIGLHGGFGDKENFRDQTGLNTKADEEDFITVYPDGLPNPGVLKARSWNAGKCCGENALSLDTDDVGFISKLIDAVSSKYRIDTKRVYATGHSNGAMMCYRLADELSDKIAAIAPNCGNIQVMDAYNPSRNVPVLNIASKLDTNVKYNGGISTGPSGHYNPPTDSCLNVVADLAGCAVQKELTESHDLYNVYSWNHCDDQSFEVLLYLTEDGGHSWPGGEQGWAGADQPSAAFNNNDVIWEFLKQYTLP
jgi:polyhydroxybutyrate depolymerase